MERFNLKITEQQRKRLEEEHRLTGLSLSELVRRALDTVYKIKKTKRDNK